MKALITITAGLALMGSAFAGTSTLVQCSKGLNTVVIVQAGGEATNIANYYVDGHQVAEADNVQVATDQDDVTSYTTDMGVSLHVKDHVGEYQGIWPAPARWVDIKDMKCSTPSAQ